MFIVLIAMLLGLGSAIHSCTTTVCQCSCRWTSGFALGREPAEHGIMDQPPIPKNEGDLCSRLIAKNRHKRRGLYHRDTVWLLFR